MRIWLALLGRLQQFFEPGDRRPIKIPFVRGHGQRCPGQVAVQACERRVDAFKGLDVALYRAGVASREGAGQGGRQTKVAEVLNGPRNNGSK